MAGYSQNEQIWLIKSAGVLRGPYSFIELINEVRKRNISILDEARTPEKRWSFIREQKELEEVVSAIREEDALLSHDTGNTNTAIQVEDTQTITTDVTNSNRRQGFNDELTPEPTFNRTGKRQSDIPKTAERFKITNDSKVPRPAYQATQMKPQQGFQLEKKHIYFVAFFICVIFSLYLFDLSSSRKLSINSEEMIHLALQYQKNGFYDKALSLYEKADAASQISTASKVQYLSLLLASDKNIQKAERLLQDIVAVQSDNPENQSLIANWSGMILHKNQKYQEADVAFEKALNLNSHSQSALVNRIVNSYFAEQFEKAIQLYALAKQKGIVHQSALFAAVLSALENKSAPISLKILTDDLSSSIRHKPEFLNEGFLLQAALTDMNQQRNEADKLIKKIFDTLPGQSAHFVRDIDILYTSSNWDYLLPICQKLARSYSGQITELVLKASCQTEARHLETATSLISEIQNSFPDGNAHVILHAYLLKEQKQMPQAKILAASTPVAAAKNLMLEICYTEMDLSCMTTALKELAESKDFNASFFYWSARLAFLKNNKELAKQELKKGLEMSKNYIPLLLLQEELNVQ